MNEKQLTLKEQQLLTIEYVMGVLKTAHGIPTKFTVDYTKNLIKYVIRIGNNIHKRSYLVEIVDLLELALLKERGEYSE